MLYLPSAMASCLSSSCLVSFDLWNTETSYLTWDNIQHEEKQSCIVQEKNDQIADNWIWDSDSSLK